MRLQYILLYFVILLFSSLNSIAQDFSITKVNGHEYSYKPSITHRLNGIKEVIVFAPKNMSEYDKYMYPCISNYFRGIGMNVKTEYVHYKVNRDSQQYLDVVWKTLDESLSDYWENSNTLLVIANCISSFGKVSGRIENIVQITLIDPITEYQWDYRFDMPNKSDKFDRKLRSEISSSYHYNPSAAHKPTYYTSLWTEPIFKSYFTTNNYLPIEGVYEGDVYKVGVKQGNDGKCYLVYLSGATNQSDWIASDIKAVLTPTATPTVFKAEWYGKWKQIMKYTIIFKDGIMTAYDEDKNPDVYVKLYPQLLSQPEQPTKEWSGTGFALKNGYVVTNHHVIEGAKTITIQGVKGNFNSEYTAEVVASDQNNDLAILKITDSSFTGFGTLPYTITSNTSDVGEDIFVLGYPLTSTMGDEIKLTTGVISSKTGFQGDVSMYQISAPIQPGNSGGPLFNKKGNVIGVVSAKHAGAENVGYAIKSTYLRNLIESAVNSTIIPTNNTVSTLPLTGKVKAEKNFVFYIKCSSETASASHSVNPSSVSADDNIRIISNPTYTYKGDNQLKILKIILSPSETRIELSSNNEATDGSGYWEWMSISPQAYISVSGQRYTLRRAEGIALSPNVTRYSYAGETKKFTLIFPSIPSTATSVDFVEGNDSEWKILGIKLN